MSSRRRTAIVRALKGFIRKAGACDGLATLTLHWPAKNTSGPYRYRRCDECRSTHQLATGRSSRSDPNFSIQEGDEASSLSVFFDFATSIKSGHEPFNLKIYIKGSTTFPDTAFFPEQTLYQKLQARGVASHIMQFRAYMPSTFSDIVFRGAQVHPYLTLQDALANLSRLLTAPVAAPSYYFLYFDGIDSACHRYGPFSKQFEEAVEHCMTQIEQLFYQNVRGKCGNTLLLLTADHGQVEVDPKLTYYLNEQAPGITRYLKTNRRGAPLVPAGSSRDMFLHVQEEHIDTVISDLRQRLAGLAEIYRTRELLEQNFFGPPSPVFLARVGNVVILPYKNETVWWHEAGKFDMHFLGHHGGLTPEEMEIPLLALPL